MRKSRKLKKNKAYFIFCEGETEKCYFESFNSINKKNIKVEPILFGQLGKTKDKLKLHRTRFFNKICEKKRLTEKDLKETKSKIFVVLDTDGINGYSKSDIDIINNFFKNDEVIEIFFSNQDFELFILLHFEFFNKQQGDYIFKIKNIEKSYQKGCCIKRKDFHRKIIQNNLDLLIKNWNKLKRFHFQNENNHIKNMDPFTEVPEIFNYFNR